MEESLKSMAMRLLGRREYTRQELGKKLLLKGSNAQEVEEIRVTSSAEGGLMTVAMLRRISALSVSASV